MKASFHDEAEFWASAAAAGELTEAELKAWSSHLAACPSCKKINDEEITMSHLIKTTLDPESPDPGFEQRMLRRLKQTRVGKGNRWYEFLLFRPALASAVAGLAMAAIVGGGFLIRGTKPAFASTTLPAKIGGLTAAIQNAPAPQEKEPPVTPRNAGVAQSHPPPKAKAPSSSGVSSPLADHDSTARTNAIVAAIPQVERNLTNTLADRGQPKGVENHLNTAQINQTPTGPFGSRLQLSFSSTQDGGPWGPGMSSKFLAAIQGTGDVRAPIAGGHRHHRHRGHPHLHHHRHRHLPRHLQVQALSPIMP